jgi:hypothetical protein
VRIEIGIAIGIEIVPLIADDGPILPNLVSSSTQTAQHCSHRVQDPGDVTDRETADVELPVFQGRVVSIPIAIPIAISMGPMSGHPS